MADRHIDDTYMRGTSHGQSKLTDAQVLAIYEDVRFPKDIAFDYPVSEGMVRRIKKRKAWNHILPDNGPGMPTAAPYSGALNGNGRLTDRNVLSIRADSRPNREIGRDYGISGTHVGRIKNRESWKHL